MADAIPTQTNESIFETIPGTTAITKLPRTAIFELLRKGELVSIRQGKRRLILRRSIDEWAMRQLVAAGFEERL